MFQVGHIPPRKGKVSTVQPLKDIAKIEQIKALLQDKPREYALFILGINSAFRCGDLLNLERLDLFDLEDGRIRLSIREGKTGKSRIVELNHSASWALRRHLESSTGQYVFEGKRGKLCVATVGVWMKAWARQVGVTERMATHSMRKTWTKQHLDRGAHITTLMFALNHSSERQTLAYCGELQKDVAALYADAI